MSFDGGCDRDSYTYSESRAKKDMRRDQTHSPYQSVILNMNRRELLVGYAFVSSMILRRRLTPVHSKPCHHFSSDVRLGVLASPPRRQLRMSTKDPNLSPITHHVNTDHSSNCRVSTNQF
jgi:hypothetical protein